MNLSGIIVGIVLIAVSSAFFTISLLINEIVGILILLFYATIFLFVGIYILLHLDKEDEIEKIKTNKKRNDFRRI